MARCVLSLPDWVAGTAAGRDGIELAGSPRVRASVGQSEREVGMDPPSYALESNSRAAETAVYRFQEGWVSISIETRNSVLVTCTAS